MKKRLLKILGAGINGVNLISGNLGSRLAMRLFSKPPRIKMRENHISFLKESLWKTLPLDGNKYACYKWGNGATKILMVHGWQSHSYRWKKYFDAFDLTKFTVYALDAPANGLTKGDKITIPIYSKAIAHLGENIDGIDILVGHSFGGINCLYAIDKYKMSSIKKMILLAPPGEIYDFMNKFKSVLGLSESVIKNLYLKFEREDGFTPENFSGKRLAKGLDIEGLIIHDKDDKETNPNESIGIHEVWTKSKLILTEGLNHKLNQQKVIDLIVDFIH